MFGINNLFLIGIIAILWDSKPRNRRLFGYTMLLLGVIATYIEIYMFCLINNYEVNFLWIVITDILTGTE